MTDDDRRTEADIDRDGDEELRDRFGTEIGGVLGTRARLSDGAGLVSAVGSRAHRRRARRRAVACVAAIVVVAAGIGGVVEWGRPAAPIAIATTPTSNGTGAPAPTTTIVPGSEIVSYRGVQVVVPGRWPVVDGMHTGFCQGPFPTTPTAFVGPQENGGPSCPAVPSSARAAPDGVWLYPEARPSDARPVGLRSGQTVFAEAVPKGARTREVWYRGIEIEIGLGRDPRIAQSILQSIGYTAGAPDTPAAGVCARRRDVDAMPTPERLAAPLVLNHGNDTLDPPGPTDQPGVSAASVWKQADSPKDSFERYRIILARVSAALPARQNPDGSLTPMTNDALAWVVYAVPTSPTINGCGSWGINLFDAHTGRELESSGYSPGP